MEEEFLKRIKQFKIEQIKQRQRGMNDYNLLTTVLKSHDEVRVHTRVIFSLLDIYAEHYQDTLFLDKFLTTINIGNYQSSSSIIYKEHDFIDLYLTDGMKHIIIENKIFAKDQKAQIKRYIDKIKKKNPNLIADNFYVIYLSIDRDRPSKESLDDLKIENEYIYKLDEKIAKFININYNKEILEWLEKCQYEVQNIINLSNSIKQYRDVVKIVIGDYTSQTQEFEDFFMHKNNYKMYNQALIDNQTIFDKEFTKEISNGFKKAKQKLYDNFYHKLVNPLLDDELTYKKYYGNSESGKKTDGDIIILDLLKKYDMKIYIRDDKIVSISIGLNEKSLKNSILKEKVEKLRDINNINYITSRTKGAKIRIEDRILLPTVENIFKLDMEYINNNIINELNRHINIFKKEL